MPFVPLHQGLFCLAVGTLLLIPKSVLSRGDPAALCRDAAAEAAVATGVPFDVLLTIATVETGRGDRPWPWTVNFGGIGRWFETASEAAATIDLALRDGVSSIDIGCFQLNYRWHGPAFASVNEMLDPVRNATYAAEYLAQHYKRTGDWALAAAAYHSATPEFAEAYQHKFEAIYARLSARSDPIVIEEGRTSKSRTNRFPLLVAGTGSVKGSLFPTVAGGQRLIGGP